MKNRANRRPLRVGVLAASLVALSASVAAVADVAAGKALYTKHCLACHHPDGRAKVKGAPDLSSKAAQGKITDAQFLKILLNGAGGMPGYKRVMSEPQAKDVMAYCRTLAK